MKQERLSDILLSSFFARLIVWSIAATAFLPGLLRDPAHAIAYYHDEHNILLHEEAARKTIAEFHQLPSWNPYFCGGMPGLANPPDTSLSPDFVLRLIFGTQPGRKLAALLMVLLGMEGTFRLARRHQASVIGAAMGAVAFACSGHFNYLAGLGWLFMFAYQLIPWVALSFEEGLRDVRWRVGGGLFLAWMVLSGGTYVTLYAGIVLLCLLAIETVRAILRSDGPESVPWHRPAVTLATMGLVSFGVTAVRVLPMLQIVRKFPRILEQHDSDSPFVVLARLAVGHGERALGAGAGEFYVGSFVVLFAIIGLFVADRGAGRFFALAVVFIALSCGEIHPKAPWVLLHELPLYSQLRLPVRLAVVASLFLALAGARGLTVIEDGLLSFCRGLAGGRLSAPAAALFATMAALLVGNAGYKAARDVVVENEIGSGQVYNNDPALAYAQGFKQSRGNRWDAHVWTYANLGSIQCFEENPLPESPALRGDLPAEEYPAPGGDASVSRIRWTPNMLVLEVDARSPARVLVNQNHDPGWRASVGQVVAHDGLLAVDVPAGKHRLVLRYRDKWTMIGLVISVGTLIALGYLASRALLAHLRAQVARFRALPR